MSTSFSNHTNPDTLPIMESFYTLQGEGHYQGTAAYFIRIAGCDIGCPWCDVKESWKTSPEQVRSIQTIVDEVIQSNATLVVVTGGEPLLYELAPLTQALKAHNIALHIETSGAYGLSGQWDWICISPKRYKKPLPTVLQAANELKVVITHTNDLRWAEEQASLVSKHCKLFLQPEWDKHDNITPTILNYVKQHPQWQLSLQIHKYLNIR